MAELSGSNLERASICPPSAVLPRVDFVSAPATRGSAFHQFLYNVREHGIPIALEKAPEEYREQLGALDFDRLPLDPDKYAGEVAFAYNPKTGKCRELGRGLAREEAYAKLEPGEIPGTADVLSLGEDWVLVLDYKTGWTDYGPIKLNWQLGFYALCAARTYGVERAQVGIVRIREDGTPYFEMAELDFLDLEDIAFRLDSVVASVEAAREALETGAPLKFKEGEHCRQCPALARCPAMITLVKEVAREAVGPATDIELTEETALPVYERIGAIRAVMKRMEDTLEAWAEKHPIPLAGGKIYGRTKLPRDFFEPTIAMPLLKEMFGENFVVRAVDTSPRITKEGLKRAIRFEGQRDKSIKIDPTMKRLKTLLVEAGGMTTKFTYPVMVHKPKTDEEVADAGRQDGAGTVPSDAAGENHA